MNEDKFKKPVDLTDPDRVRQVNPVAAFKRIVARDVSNGTIHNFMSRVEKLIAQNGASLASLLSCMLFVDQRALYPEDVLMWTNDEKEAQVVLNYLGWLRLFRKEFEEQGVEEIQVEIVDQNDTFELRLGTERQVVHVPSERPDNIYKAGYCTARFKGRVQLMGYMNKHDLSRFGGTNDDLLRERVLINSLPAFEMFFGRSSEIRETVNFSLQGRLGSQRPSNHAVELITKMSMPNIKELPT